MNQVALALAAEGLNQALRYGPYTTPPNRNRNVRPRLRGSRAPIRTFTSAMDVTEDKQTTKKNNSVAVGNISHGAAAHHYYKTADFFLHDVPDYLRLRLLWNTLFPRLTSRSGGFWLNAAGDCGDFSVVKFTLSGSEDTTSNSYYRSIPQACAAAGFYQLVGTSGSTGGTYQSSCFHVNTARQTCMWFGALNLDMAEAAMSNIQNYSPIGNIVYGGASAATTSYQGGVNTKAVTIRGFTREITFTNMDANDLYFTFYECSPKEDLPKGYGPLELWQSAFATATQNVLLYPQAAYTSYFTEGDGVTAVDGVLNRSIHTINHSGETPLRKGLIGLHKKWIISTPKTIRVSNGESLKFTQNYKGGHVTYMDVNSPDGKMFYKRGLTKGTLVTVTGHMGVQANAASEQPTGVVTTGSGQFVCRSESTTYFEAMLPSLPDSIMQTDNLYKGEPAGSIAGITSQVELGVDNTTLEVETQGVHDG